MPSEVRVGEGAIAEHTKFQDETSNSVHIATVAAHQERASVYTNNNTSFGARIARNDVNVASGGEGAETSAERGVPR